MKSPAARNAPPETLGAEETACLSAIRQTSKFFGANHRLTAVPAESLGVFGLCVDCGSAEQSRPKSAPTPVLAKWSEKDLSSLVPLLHRFVDDLTALEQAAGSKVYGTTAALPAVSEQRADLCRTALYATPPTSCAKGSVRFYWRARLRRDEERWV
jgi:hypothetical protein